MKKQYLLPFGLMAIGVIAHFKKPIKEKQSITQTQPETVHALKNNQGQPHLKIRGSPKLDRAAQYFKLQLSTILSCYEVAQCRGKKEQVTTEEAYQSLMTLYAWQLRHGYRSKEVTDLVRGFLVFKDIGVKKVSLKILSIHDPEDQNLAAILKHVMMEQDKELHYLGAKEMSRYSQLSLVPRK